MARRRRNDDFEGLVGPIAIILVFFGVAIVAFLKALLLVLLIGGRAALVCFLLYRLGRSLWQRQLDIQEFLPNIDWTVPAIPSFDSAWIDIRYPEVSSPAQCAPPHVIGTSGAWKAILGKLERFPTLYDSLGPRDLQHRVSACEAAAAEILRQACATAGDLARQKQPDLEQQVKRLHDVEKTLETRVRPRLDTLRHTIETLSEGHFIERRRADRLRSRLSEYEIELSNRRRQARERASQQEQAVRCFLDPVQRERTLDGRIHRDLAAMREVIVSKDFAGAAAEVAVIEELSSLPAGSLVFNDVRLESGRYIHFEGKPLMSAQIDTLAITPAGVFVIEVKNWSSEFARSGEGFNPYEQASRASYLVFDRLRSAGISVKVRAIIATQGSLPDRGDSKVAVVPIGRLRRYIEGGPASMAVDVPTVRSSLGL